MPFSTPTGNDLRPPQQVLTNLLQNFAEQEYVHSTAGPLVNFANEGGKIPGVNLADMIRKEDLRRAEGATPKVAGFGLNENSFMVDKYSRGADVTDEDIARNGGVIADVLRLKSEYCIRQVRQQKETIFNDKILSASVWTNQTQSISTRWDAQTGSDPLGDIADMHEAIRARSSVRANKLILGIKVYNTLKRHTDILDLIDAYGSPEAPRMVILRTIAALAEVDNVYVMGAINVTSNEGATTNTFANINDSSILLYYAPDSAVAGDASAFYQFNWAGSPNNGADIAIRTYRLDDNDAQRVVATAYVDFAPVTKELAQFATGVVS